jgi:hypothetical protein
MNKKDILFFNKKLKYTFHKSTPTTKVSTTSVTDDETCVLALIWTIDVELELFCVGGIELQPGSTVRWHYWG